MVWDSEGSAVAANVCRPRASRRRAGPMLYPLADTMCLLASRRRQMQGPGLTRADGMVIGVCRPCRSVEGHVGSVLAGAGLRSSVDGTQLTARREARVLRAVVCFLLRQTFSPESFPRLGEGQSSVQENEGKMATGHSRRPPSAAGWQQHAISVSRISPRLQGAGGAG